MADLKWEELSPEGKKRLEDLHDGSNENMVDLIRYPEQKMCISRSYLKIKDEIANFPLKEDDIWIVTYPKCGTTWMQEIVTLLINDMDEDYAKLPLFARTPFLDIDALMDNQKKNLNRLPMKVDSLPPFVQEKMAKLMQGHITYAKQLEGRRVIKTHMPFDFLPKNLTEKCKVVYVARSPKDCIVSYFHHMTDLPMHGCTASFPEFVDMFMSTEILYGDYFTHVESGWKRKDLPNVKFIWYEDLKKNTKEELNKLGEFLNHPLPEDTLDRLVHHVSFDVMKKNPAANPTAALKVEKGNFLRKGTVGDWKNYFKAENLEMIDTWVQTNLDRTGIKLPA